VDNPRWTAEHVPACTSGRQTGSSRRFNSSHTPQKRDREGPLNDRIQRARIYGLALRKAVRVRFIPVVATV
jgi:hypothetical protein